MAVELCAMTDLALLIFFVDFCLFLRLVTITGTRENIAKAFSAIGKKIEQVSEFSVHLSLSFSLSLSLSPSCMCKIHSN